MKMPTVDVFFMLKVLCMLFMGVLLFYAIKHNHWLGATTFFLIMVIRYFFVNFRRLNYRLYKNE